MTTTILTPTTQPAQPPKAILCAPVGAKLPPKVAEKIASILGVDVKKYLDWYWGYYRLVARPDDAAADLAKLQAGGVDFLELFQPSDFEWLKRQGKRAKQAAKDRKAAREEKMWDNPKWRKKQDAAFERSLQRFKDGE